MPVFRSAKLTRFALVAAALSLAGCDRGAQDGDLAELDNQITGNEADPALTSALEDQIMVDPALTQQSNRNAVRPAETPAQAQYPVAQGGQAPADGASAGRAAPSGAARAAPPSSVEQVSGSVGEGAGCGSDLNHNPAWASRLPKPFAVFPGGRLTDAAGNRACRVVTFTSAARPQQVLGWYRERALGAGYSAEQQRREGDHILAGAGQQGAFFLIVTPLRNGGSDVALIANNGL